MMTMIRPESLSGPSAVSLFDRAGDRGTVELHGEPVSEADCGEFEVIEDVHEPDENTQDRSRSHLCGIGWIPGLRAAAAGAGAYLALRAMARKDNHSSPKYLRWAPSRHFIPWSSWSCFETSCASPNR